MDKKALEVKENSLKQKIKNSQLYIEEIDQHEKSIFEFWKFANKDELRMLAEADVEHEESKLEKVYDYYEDLEDIELQIDKKQRNILNKEEKDAIFIASTNVLEALNNIDNDEILENSLNNLKQELENNRVLFNSISEANLFGNTIEDHTKLKLLGNKKHRESIRDKFNILDINLNTTNKEYQERLIDILAIIANCMEKVTSPISIPIYKISENEFVPSIFVVSFEFFVPFNFLISFLPVK